VPYESAKEGYTRVTGRHAYPGHKAGQAEYFLEDRFVSKFGDAGPVYESEKEEAAKIGYKSAGEVTLTYKLTTVAGGSDVKALKLVVAAVHSDFDK
jgi:hypothetical protein